MLSDIERKMLRIIANYSAGQNIIPTIHELTVKTGRDRAGVMDVLSVLTRERYILWTDEDPDNIVLLEAWERRPTLRRPESRSTFNPKTSPFMN